VLALPGAELDGPEVGEGPALAAAQLLAGAVEKAGLALEDGGPGDEAEKVPVDHDVEVQRGTLVALLRAPGVLPRLPGANRPPAPRAAPAPLYCNSAHL
jgi:hypothetical protein